MTLEDLKYLKIEDTPLSIHAINRLEIEGYRFLYQLLTLTFEDLKKIVHSDYLAQAIENYVKKTINSVPGFDFSAFVFDFSSIAISDFQFLSNRSKHSLLKLGLYLMSEITDETIETLKTSKGVGLKTFNEIKVVLNTNEKLKKNSGIGFDELLGQNKTSESLDTNIKNISSLSVRAFNCLNRQGFKTLRSVEEYSLEDLLQIKHMGRKTAIEIYNLVQEMKQLEKGGSINLIASNSIGSWIDEVEDGSLKIIVKDAFVCPEDYRFSNYFYDQRLNNQLLELKVNTLYDALLFYKENNDFLTVGTAKKFKEAIKRLFSEQHYIDLKPKINDDLSSFYNSFFGSLNEYFAINEIGSYYLQLSPDKRSIENILLENNIKYKIKIIVYSFLNDEVDGLSFDDLMNHFNDNAFCDVVMEGINALLFEKRIFIQDGIYQAKRITILEALEKTNAKHLEICNAYFCGKTLDEVGKEHKLTRERIRQIIAKDFKYAKTVYPVVYEDKYVYLFDKYDISRDEFMKITDSDAAWKYCGLLTKKRKNQPLNEAIDDTNFTDKQKAILFNILDQRGSKSFIVLDGEKIRKSKASICRHMVKTFYPNLVAKPQKWVKLFLRYCKSNKDILDACPDILVTTRFGDHYFDQMILSKKGLRFYNFDRYFGPLFKGINLDSYHDFEISTQILFNKNKLLMKKYDIKDCYELHNLLRRTKDRYGLDNLSLSRAPIISFDNFDRRDFYYSIIDSNKSITISELATIIEKRIGVSRGVANNEAYIAFHAYWDKQDKILNDDEIKKLQLRLNEYCYTSKELSSIFEELFPNIEFKNVSIRQLEDLGIHKAYNSDCYFVGLYSKEEYVEKLLKNNNGVLDFNKNAYKGLDEYYYLHRVDTLQVKGKIFAFKRLCYISLDRLAEFGVSMDMIKSYCDSVYDFVDDSYFFSITTLIKHGHKHELYDLGFDDYFYEKLLINNSDNRFASLRVGNDSFILRKGDQRFTLKDVVLTLFGKNNSMSLDALQQKLETNYNVYFKGDTRIYSLEKKVVEAGLYFDETMQKIYRNEEEFLNDLGDYDQA